MTTKYNKFFVFNSSRCDPSSRSIPPKISISSKAPCHYNDAKSKNLLFRRRDRAATLGLATVIALAESGHKVTVLERRKQADKFKGRGSGIIVSPNYIRLFQQWGVGGFFERSCLNGDNQVHRYVDGELLRIGKKSSWGSDKLYPL